MCAVKMGRVFHENRIHTQLKQLRLASQKHMGNQWGAAVTKMNTLSLFFSPKRDIGKVVEALYGDNPPPIMIIGHSMGGAIAVHTAAANHIPSLLGLCVIDVVEGKSFRFHK